MGAKLEVPEGLVKDSEGAEMSSRDQNNAIQLPQTNDETLKLALEVAQLGFWDHDIVQRITHRSPEWAQMLGYTLEEVGQDLDFWLNNIHPDDRDVVDQEVEAHESGRQRLFRVEHRMRTKDGQWKWILNWGRVVARDKAGKPLRALGFHLDITERIQAEAALARAEKLSTIGTLAGGIAHDFNNLLTIILGNLTLAKEETDYETRGRFLSHAEGAIRRSQKLTGRLLTYARGGTPVLKPVDLPIVIGEARDLVLSGSSSLVQIQAEEDLPQVAGSEEQLLQVFQNILLNSCQAMPDGGLITVTCRKWTLKTPIKDLLSVGEYVETIISDHGLGIPSELIEKVLDPFFTTRPEGQGLGLTTAHSIVTNHGGLLEILTGQGEGASLRVLLPVAKEDRVPSEPSGKATTSGKVVRILVVDDDELVREVATEVIRKLGFTSVGTDDGGKATELYAEAKRDSRPFHAVLMDLTIPGGIGGKEAVARILEVDPAAKVIVSSGYSDDPVMAHYQEYGFKARLTKPYELSELRQVLTAILVEK